MKALYAILFICCTVGQSRAQDFGADLKRMITVMQTKPFTALVEVQVKDGKKVIEKMSAEIAIDGNYYFSSMNGQVMVNGKTEMVIVSTQQKQLIVNNKITFANLPEKTQAESWGALKGITSLGKLNGLQGYRLPGDEMYSSTEIWFNADTGMLHQVIYHNANPLVGDPEDRWTSIEISYKTTWTKPDFKKYFDTSMYVTRKGDTYQPTSAYKAYTLLNYLNKAK
jgi:hypothetical protein